MNFLNSKSINHPQDPLRIVISKIIKVYISSFLNNNLFSIYYREKDYGLMEKLNMVVCMLVIDVY